MKILFQIKYKIGDTAPCAVRMAYIVILWNIMKLNNANIQRRYNCKSLTKLRERRRANALKFVNAIEHGHEVIFAPA